MYLIPLNQIESVDLVIHALRAAGGEADCTMCPVRKVCTKQCLAVADGIREMVASGTLPAMDHSEQSFWEYLNYGLALAALGLIALLWQLRQRQRRRAFLEYA